MNYTIRDGPNPSAPGNNNWSKDNVIVSDKGIKLKRENNTSAEIEFKFEGYGKYGFSCEVPNLPSNVVLGIFLYADDQHEIDIEFSKWGSWFMPNCQFVIQPNEYKLFRERFYNFKTKNEGYIIWQPNYIEFCLNNRKTLVNRKVTGNMKFILNLWAIKPDYNKVEVNLADSSRRTFNSR